MNKDKKDPTKTPEYKKALEQSKEVCRQLKKVLKLRSKSELITIVINYASDLQECQEMLKQLYEENKSLKNMHQNINVPGLDPLAPR